MPRSKGSNELRELRRRIGDLRRHFLPDPFDPTGSYEDPTAVQTDTRAFTVFAHAELESYFEAVAKKLTKQAESTWKKRGKVTRACAAVLASVGKGINFPKVPDAYSSAWHQKAANCVQESIDEMYKRIVDNHGIKESNLASMFLPLGVPPSAFGTALLATLNSLGTTRGKLAHNGARQAIDVLDPEIEYKRMHQIVADLSAFDQWISGQCRAST